MCPAVGKKSNMTILLHGWLFGMIQLAKRISSMFSWQQAAHWKGKVTKRSMRSPESWRWGKFSLYIWRFWVCMYWCTYNFLVCHWQGHIQRIRENYTKDFKNKDVTRRQIAVATYLIDKLALRAGNEKVHPTGTCVRWLWVMFQYSWGYYLSVISVMCLVAIWFPTFGVCS